jgi:hypothetical protein
MKVNIKKVVIWFGGGAVVAVSASAVVWNNSGFRAAERDAEAAYREVEALGLPLGADAYAATFVPAPEENNAPELLDALTQLEKANRKLTSEERSLARELTWNIDLDSGAVEDRVKAQEKLRPAMEAVRGAIQKPRFVPQRDWADPVSMAFPEYSGLRLAAIISCANAISANFKGDRELAVQRLGEATKIGNLSGDTPTFIGGLVHSAILAVVSSTMRECVVNDPKGAARYAEALSFSKRKPFGVYLRGEVYFAAGVSRNYNAKDAFTILAYEDGGREVPPPREVNRDGLPKDPTMRAFLGYSLNEWIPILRQLNADGSIKNADLFQRAFDQFNKNLVTEKRSVAKFHKVLVPELTSLTRVEIRDKATVAVAFAFAKLVEYHNQKGAYPTSLTEAGVTATDPLSKDKKPLGYSVKNGEMRVWSVGANGKDDGGLTHKESFNLNPRPGGYPSGDDGDIAWVMPAERIAGKS